MKPFKTICVLIALSATSLSYGQFLDKLGKKAEKAVERTVERRVEKETQKSTDRALDSVVEAPKKSKKQKRKEKKKKKKESNNVIGSPDTISAPDNTRNDSAAINICFLNKTREELVTFKYSR